MTVTQIVEAVRKGPDPDNQCQLCGVLCEVQAGMVPTALCHSCAQSSVDVLASVLGPGTSVVPTLLLSRCMLTLMGVCVAAKGQADSQHVVRDAANVLEVWEEAARRHEAPGPDTLKKALDDALEVARRGSSAVEGAANAVQLRQPKLWQPGDE